MKLSTHGILFFGTPHHGGNGVTLGELVLRIASVAITTSDRAMKNLRKESEWLETLDSTVRSVKTSTLLFSTNLIPRPYRWVQLWLVAANFVYASFLLIVLGCSESFRDCSRDREC